MILKKKKDKHKQRVKAVEVCLIYYAIHKLF